MTRATVFAVVCVTLAAAGHAAAGRTMIAPWTIVAGFGATLAVAWVLAGTERSLATIAGGLLGGQFALHALFVAGMAGQADMEHSSATIPADAHGGLTMTLAHSVAALVAAWWLWRGERLAWVLVRRAAVLAAAPLRALAAALAVRPAPAGPVRIPVRAVRPLRPRPPLLEHSLIRRGPPLRSGALAR
jgi:hypothetical protein